MDAFTGTINGQVTIPKTIRRKLGIGQGSREAFFCENGQVVLRVLHRAPVEVESGFGILGTRGKKLPANFDAASQLAPKARHEGPAKLAGKR